MKTTNCIAAVVLGLGVSVGAAAQAPEPVPATLVNCNLAPDQDPLVQNVIDTAPIGSPIVILGECSNQGLITINRDDVVIVGIAGSPTPSIIDASFTIDGVTGVVFSNITLQNLQADDIAISVTNLAHVVFVNSVVRAEGLDDLTAIQVATSRVVMLGSRVSVVSMSGNAAALVSATNSATILAGEPNSLTASAAGEAFGAVATIGGVLAAKGGDSFSATGMLQSRAVELNSGAQFFDLDLDEAIGPILLDGDFVSIDSNATFIDVNQVNGQIAAKEGRLRIESPETFSTPSPISLRASTLAIDNATLAVDIVGFLDSTVVVENNSTVDGSIQLRLDSRLAVLENSMVGNVIADERRRDVFVDDTSVIDDLDRLRKRIGSLFQ